MPVTYGWYSQRVLLFLLLEIIIDSSVHLVFLHVKLSFNLLWAHAVIISIFRWSNWNTERLCSLPKVKQLLSEQARTWTVCLIPKPRIWSYKMWTWISVRHCSPSAYFSVPLPHGILRTWSIKCVKAAGNRKWHVPSDSCCVWMLSLCPVLCSFPYVLFPHVSYCIYVLDSSTFYRCLL